MKYFIYLEILFFCACSNLPEQAITKQLQREELPLRKINLLGASVFGKPIELIDTFELFELTEEQKNDFLIFFNLEENKSYFPNKRIYKYLEKRLKNFNFHADTLIASESLAGNQGNCLSLAILTNALARISGVDTSFDLVETEPVYQQEANIILTSQHVRSILYNPLDSNSFVLVRGQIIVDYFPVGYSRTLRSVSEAEFFAMYYDNKAAEFFIRNEINKAYWYTKKSLELKPDGVVALNMIALLHQNTNNFDYAENIYLYGLEVSDDKLVMLSNYHSLLKSQGRLDEAKKIVSQIEKFENLNPFKWISMANLAYNEGDYLMAISYYRKASKMAPYLDEPFVGVARSQYLLGNLEEAKSSIFKALEKVHKKSSRDIYQAKYDMLTQLLKNNDRQISITTNIQK